MNVVYMYKKEKRGKNKIKKDSGSPTFIAALFAIAKTWKKPKCSQMEEWIKKMWNIYTTEYYSTIKNGIIYIPSIRPMILKGTSQGKYKYNLSPDFGSM